MRRDILAQVNTTAKDSLKSKNIPPGCSFKNLFLGGHFYLKTIKIFKISNISTSSNELPFLTKLNSYKCCKIQRLISKRGDVACLSLF